jgi:hypothetical protein
MATPRKRHPIAPTKPPVDVVEDNIDEFTEEATAEIFEMLAEAEKVEDEPEVPFREESIIPTDDVGPRFVEVEKKPVAKTAPVVQSPSTPQPVPKRHPRNIPKFSRTK